MSVDVVEPAGPPPMTMTSSWSFFEAVFAGAVVEGMGNFSYLYVTSWRTRRLAPIALRGFVRLAYLAKQIHERAHLRSAQMSELSFVALAHLSGKRIEQGDSAGGDADADDAAIFGI